MQAVLHSGRSLDAAGSALDLAAMFGDGGNLYGYLGGNPRGRSDPLGLFFTSPADLVGHAVMIGMRGCPRRAREHDGGVRRQYGG